MNIYFEKVSFNQFLKDSLKVIEKPEDMSDDEIAATIKEMYDKIPLPTRGTPGSAGYDFYFPFVGMQLKPGNTELIPTGIRAYMEPGIVLMIYPRSGLGFKTGVRLANSTGVIDSDYYNSDNEGHIMIKFLGGFKDLELNQLDRFAQGVFIPYYTVNDDMVMNAERHGGFGSTDKNVK